MTPETAGLLAALDTNLAGLSLPFTSEADADRIYEAYIFALVIAAATEAGATVHYRQGSGKEVTDLDFRGSPGLLHSSDTRWTFAVLDFARAPLLEVHIRVKVTGGRANTESECDILILDQHTAGTSRVKRQSPQATKCLAIIECKFYSTTLPVALGREFAYLCRDRRSVTGYFVANQHGSQVWRILGNEPNAICEFGVRPGSRQAAHLATLLREAFKRHLVRHNPDHQV
jgi:hypothetical protein